MRRNLIFTCGNHIASARAAAKLSQRELAALAGLHRNSVRYWEAKRAIRSGGFALERLRDTLATRGVTVAASPPSVIIAG